MIRNPVLFLLLFAFYASHAQNDDNNVVIQSAKEEYTYVKGNSANPVKVKQELAVSYLCNDFRTNVNIVEFYNDQVELNDVDVKINGDKIKNFTPAREYYSSDGIFYSDAHVCYFNLPLEKKGTTSEVIFKKTVLDPRYFTNIYFSEPYAIGQKEVSITIPKWMNIEVREYNFKGYSIEKKIEDKGNEDVYTYTIRNLPAFRNEQNAPGPTYIEPHLLVMTKYATPEGTRITYFNTLDDQYKWYRQLVKDIGNDVSLIKAKTEEITKGLGTDVEKVKAIYLWVQENIRYIAFEDGIAGFKPEKAQEVLRKKYGDCKGMGNLMSEMLKSIGLDGRKCWLGTNHIAYDYSTPSLGVDNHMICAWINNGKTWYLDATEKYIGFNEIAERIQGRQVLIEDGDKYILQHIPVTNPLQNTSFEKRMLAVNGADLVGKVIQTWKGESKEWLLTGLHEIKKDRQEDALKKFLAEGNSNYQISNLKIYNISDYNSDLRIEYDLLFKNAVTSFNSEMYIDVDNRKDFSQSAIDTVKRKMPYLFSYKNHVVFETEIEVPEGAKVGTLPSSFKVEKPEYIMTGNWSVANKKIVYKKEIQLKKTYLSREQFQSWNSDVKKLEEFYNNQLAITL